jgi:hypothetical protein
MRGLALLCRPDFDGFNSTLYNTTGYVVTSCDIQQYGSTEAGAASLGVSGLLLTVASLLALLLMGGW